MKMISNVSQLIKIVYYTDEPGEDGDTKSLQTANYSAKLKSIQDYEDWFLPISTFLQKEQFI